MERKELAQQLTPAQDYETASLAGWAQILKECYQPIEKKDISVFNSVNVQPIYIPKNSHFC
jgi:hypothetical protein